MGASGRGLGWSIAMVVPFMMLTAAAEPASPPDGAALYRQRCAGCHDASGSRAPTRDILATRTPEAIVDILINGSMAPMVSGLSKADVEAIALHLTGKAPAQSSISPPDPEVAARCASASEPGTRGPRWNGWSPTRDNARFQAAAGLTGAELPRLKVKWAFQFVGGVGSQPVVLGGRLYLGAGGGHVYALDAHTGCLHWRADVKGGVRAALSVGPLAGPSGGSGRLAVFVGDRTGGVHALDAATGQSLWSARVDAHRFATITGAPALYRGRLYVPVSSSEEIGTYIRDYRCCTFRGSVAALDAATGRRLWQTFTIAQPVKQFGTDPAGKPRFGPAGGAVWSAPTIDPKRGVLYVATGDSYTDAPNTGSDAVLAFDLITGKQRWGRQITTADNYMVGCTGNPGQPAACPEELGPDHDFGASPVLRNLPNGRAVLLAGQKSGEVTALDPDRQGAVRWRTRLGQGGALGGVEWGMAAERDLLFVPIADPYTPKAESMRGMYALRITDGARVWSSPVPDPDCAIAPRGSLINICTSGLSAAPTAIPGMVIAGSLDGILRAWDARTGRVSWQVDIGQTRFRPINAAEPKKGDTMNAGGATVAGGMVFQVSGYQTSGTAAVNLLLAFSVDGK